jgi:hypothetical protein
MSDEGTNRLGCASTLADARPVLWEAEVLCRPNLLRSVYRVYDKWRVTAAIERGDRFVTLRSADDEPLATFATADIVSIAWFRATSSSPASQDSSHD